MAATYLSSQPAAGVGFYERVRVVDSDPDRTGPKGGYADIVEEVAPSVVSIATSRMVRAYQRDFDTGRVREVEIPQPRGLGSGVILSSDGYIITNNHVISGGSQIIVTLNGRRGEYPAEVVGVDHATDIAILKIEGTDLPAATFGNSRRVKAGDFVLAIGSPFGLEHTVTSGIVSATGRTDLRIVNSGQGYENFIQTDASINPGNSGGGLIDNKGRVIGINTAILSRTGGNVGIGFAIPAEMALDVAAQLVEHGRISRGYLGVVLDELSEELSQQLGATVDGVLVRAVEREGPAFASGVEPGDVIIGADGMEVDSLTQLRLHIGNRRPGEVIKLDIQRGDKRRIVEVVAAERPQNFQD